jgi:hypothetical protein
LEVIGRLGYRRLERELRRREAALREADQALEKQTPTPLVAHEPEAQPRLAQSASPTRGLWECDFCGSGFHGYGAYLNHRCASDD